MTKPPYRVPSMREIARVPWNGLTVASTFSGCGGSCLGYNENLFDEYVRILRGLMPRAFIAENVSGLVKGTAKGFFLEILAKLRASGYRVRAALLDAQWLGVPQSRQRVIFVGFRSDVRAEFSFPRPLPYRYSISDAFPHLGDSRALHDTKRSTPEKDVTDRPSPAITNGCNDGGRSGGGSRQHFKIRPGGWQQFSDERGEKPLPCITVCEYSARVVFSPSAGFHRGGETRGADLPSPVVMARGMGGSGMGQVSFHDGLRERKFTIDEVKALCSFPRDFVLKGSYAQQWERLGNCVVPFMARAVGLQVASALSCARGHHHGTAAKRADVAHPVGERRRKKGRADGPGARRLRAQAQ